MTSILRFHTILITVLLLLTGCKSLQDYQNARARMTAELEILKETVHQAELASPDGKFDLKNDTYLLGRLVHGLRTYKNFTNIAANVSSDFVTYLQDTTENGSSMDLALLTQLRAEFNQGAYRRFFDEIVLLQYVTNPVQEYCLVDPYGRACQAWGAVAPGLFKSVRLLRKNMSELSKL
jgi:hypothetical protein